MRRRMLIIVVLAVISAGNLWAAGAQECSGVRKKALYDGKRSSLYFYTL